ncbi:hypothetical protein CCACVL1_30337, partial [Corchorus capsularis]
TFVYLLTAVKFVGIINSRGQK